ncbi:hypothetical protein TNCV_528681 [Trichonephila clavipes]|nr:hypothetical protein TNCV_528681 [Trichonephila clavipes]
MVISCALGLVAPRDEPRQHSDLTVYHYKKEFIHGAFAPREETLQDSDSSGLTLHGRGTVTLKFHQD